MSITTVNQRIAEMINHFTKGNKSAFAKAVGISNQSLGEIVGSRQSAPSFAALQKIALAYPTVSLHWLVLGEGGSDIRFEMTDEDDYHDLERLADELEDGTSKQMDAEKEPTAAQSENSLWELRAAEETARVELGNVIERHWDARRAQAQSQKPGSKDSEAEKVALNLAQEDRILHEAKYVEAVRNRIRAERALFGFGTDSGTAVYRLGEQGEPGSLYGGLLSKRLSISNEAAEELVKSGKIRATYIDGEGYRITEQAVRIFLQYE
jgi:excisionase family DNA binding protein